MAAFLHFFFLSSFCWVLTEAWQSYMAVTGRLRSRLIRKRFLCLGWGEPGCAGLCHGALGSGAAAVAQWPWPHSVALPNSGHRVQLSWGSRRMSWL